MVPGSPRSGPCAESSDGPNPGGVLLAGIQSGVVTADVCYRNSIEREDAEVRSILGLGRDGDRAAAPGSLNFADDAMSVSSLEGSVNLKRVREACDNASDSDVGGTPGRVHKVLRSRIIGSDSDGPSTLEPLIVLSDSPDNVSNKVRGRKPRGKTREAARLDTSINLDADLANLEFASCPVRIAGEKVADKEAEDIAGMSYAWLNDMELIRTKSKKLNGKLSGCLKERIVCVRSVIGILVDRVKDTGDITYLRRRNDELTAQLRESRREESRLQGFLKEADAKAEILSNEIFELRRRIGSMSAEPEKFPPLPTKTRQRTPAKINTPKREKGTRRESSVTETLKGYDNQLEVISRFDETIMKFEELLKKMKLDLYGSVESVAEKSAAIMNPPPKRGVPRIISNIQLGPPRPTPGPVQDFYEEQEPHSDLDSWTEVTGRRNRRQVRIAAGSNSAEPTGIAARAIGTDRMAGKPQPPSNLSGGRRRAPRNTAVAIKANIDGLSYAEIIKQTREKVNLKELGIVNPHIRRAANGGVIIEIVGPEGAVKADTLASRLREVIGQNAAVSRPVVKADLKISGFDEFVIKDEIITIVTEFGDCLASDVRVGSFRPMRNGLNMTWVQCPLSAALKISKKGKVNLGWSVARVELMRAKPVQCFKWWHFGYVRNNCDSPTDRTGHCFKCGGANHSSYTCLSNPFCVICADLGHESSHRLGSVACSAMTRGL